MAKNYRKDPIPNENALPPLINPEAEAKRLASIQQRKEELRQERIRRKEVKKRTEEIFQMVEEKKMNGTEGTQTNFIEPLFEGEIKQENRAESPI